MISTYLQKNVFSSEIPEEKKIYYVKKANELKKNMPWYKLFANPVVNDKLIYNTNQFVDVEK